MRLKKPSRFETAKSLYGAYEIAVLSPSNSYPAGKILVGMSQAVSQPTVFIRTFAYGTIRQR
jgi:hypothetical protein